MQKSRTLTKGGKIGYAPESSQSYGRRPPRSAAAHNEAEAKRMLAEMPQVELRRRQLTQENLVVTEGRAHDGIQGTHDNATDIIRTKSRTNWRRVDPVNMNVRQAMCL